MNRRLISLLVPALCLVLLSTTLYLGSDHLTTLPSPHIPFTHQNKSSSSPPIDVSQVVQSSVVISSTLVAFFFTTAPSPTAPSPTAPSPVPTISDGTVLDAEEISPYITAILNPTVTELPRLECSSLNTSRYEALLEDGNSSAALEEDDSEHIDYYFALDLRNCLPLLPRLLGSIIEAIRFLGPHRCALSIVEGNSPDGTADILKALHPFLNDLGLSYFYQPSKIDPSKKDRIRRLAALRNLAIQPLLDNAHRTSEDTTVLFINDVAACTEDILELALQRRSLGADMTCAMDWTFVGTDPTFYDVWIARTIHGDSFFDISADGSWNSAWNLFWNAPETASRYHANLPFQVFACWNGATAFSAAPLLEGVRFRDNCGGNYTECHQGEPQLFCKDLWFRGFRKIAVIPTVNLEYSNERGKRIKDLKGYTGDLVLDQTEDANRIDWVLEPPEKVKCMPTWDNQFWRPWNETLNKTTVAQ